MNENTILRTVPAAGDLHKVPGFDPLKHLQRVTDGSGNLILQLGLPYKRLWFRLACPSGRLLLNPLRITDQMAIFEAQVYFQREDPTPASSFTSTKTAREARAYIRAAQDEALSIALDNAGFGIQLCDVTQGMDGGKSGSETPPPQVNAAAQVQPQRKAPAVNTAADTAERPATELNVAENVPPAQPMQTAADTLSFDRTEQLPEALTASAASVQVQNVEETDPHVIQHTNEMHSSLEAAPARIEEPVKAEVSSSQQTASEMAGSAPAENQAVETAPHQEPFVKTEREDSVVTVLKFPGQQGETGDGNAPLEESAPAASGENETAGAAPTYTEDMSIEDIAARMTVAEARDMVVSAGTCKGWTLGQVLERRPASLKFFATPFCEASNIFKAAATLMLQEANQQKAG